MKLTEAVIAMFIYIGCVVCSRRPFEEQQQQPLQCYVGTPSKLELMNCTVKVELEEQKNVEDEEQQDTLDGGDRQKRHLEGGGGGGEGARNVSSLSIHPNGTNLIHDEQEDSNMIDSEDGGEGRRQANSCLVFVPLLLNTSSSLLRNASKTGDETTRFDCDSNRICEENYKYERNRRENVTFGGQLGDLFCCRGSKCNERHSAFPTRFAPSFDRPLRCSAGPNVKESILCLSETLDCFNRTLFVANATFEEYGCDLSRYCTGRSGNPNGECFNFLNEHGRQMEMCCCATNDCNAPSSFFSSQQSLGFGMFDKMKWEMYGWMAITMITLSVAAVVLVVRRRRNRMYSDISVISDPRYQRLTANFTAGDTDDVKMLLAD